VEFLESIAAIVFGASVGAVTGVGLAHYMPLNQLMIYAS
jgi:hypothetical protein